MLNIKVKYFDEEMKKDKEKQLHHIGGNKRSNWIDVRVSRIEVNGEPRQWNEQGIIHVMSGDYVKAYLGFAMQLPEGYEALTAPRGSTYKNFGLLQTNSVGVVDEAYCGDNDEWFIPFYATRWEKIEKHDRVAQFRIQEKMPEVEFDIVDMLGNADRGGEGASGTK